MAKSHTTVTVNLDRILANLQVMKSCCKPDVDFMAVIKANAYGHGAVRVARALAGKVEWFAVNDIKEAIELRENNISNPILVFGVPTPEDAGLYKKHNITATVSSGDHFRMLHEGTDYHLNFDTGMGRLGFSQSQVEEVAKRVKKHSELCCTGIYSHFATADDPASSKVEQQLQIFKTMQTYFDSDLLAHMCNTAGIVQCPEAHYDMVRTGIGIYGYAPGQVEISGLEPALTWKTNIIQVKQIKKLASVSYGATWMAEEDGYVGVLPVGYDDGIPRSLSGNFNVMIDGAYVPVVGTVTMNYCMVNLGMQKVSPGTEVQLLTKRLTAQTWARAIGTIPYEILTGISSKLARTYSLD